MATAQIPWGDGSGEQISVGYSGSPGTAPVSLSSPPNAGLDRRKTLLFKTTGGAASKEIVVSQPGAREEFTTADGWQAKGGIYAVLK